MNKKELREEARKQAEKLRENQTLGVYDRDEDFEYDNGWNKGEISGYEDGYYDGALPREKRIAELEAQIEKMKCCSMCKYYSMSFLPYWCTKNNTAPHCTSKCDKWEIKEK